MVIAEEMNLCNVSLMAVTGKSDGGGDQGGFPDHRLIVELSEREGREEPIILLAWLIIRENSVLLVVWELYLEEMLKLI